jgi:hypothetical protein
VKITRLAAAGHKAPSELPQSVAFAAGTTLHTYALLLLSVGEVEGEHMW